MEEGAWVGMDMPDTQLVLVLQKNCPVGQLLEQQQLMDSMAGDRGNIGGYQQGSGLDQKGAYFVRGVGTPQQWAAVERWKQMKR
jgi:hypothetical protein